MAAQTKQSGQDMPALSFDAYKVLLPSIIGIAMSNASINLAVQQAHRSTGVSTFSGWVALAASIIFAALFAATLHVKRFPKKAIFLSTFIAIHVSGLSALSLAIIEVVGLQVPAAITLLLQTGVMAGSTLISFYWMRKLRGTSAQAVLAVAFCALALSEIVTFAFSFAGEPAWYAAAFALSFAQFGTTRASRAMDVPGDSFPAISELYFGTDENRFSNRSFLVTAAIGIWFISIPIGMARGFSTGDPVYMSTLPRFLMTLFTCVVSVAWVRFGLASRMHATTTSIWVVIEILLAVGAILFALFPTNTGLGASLAMASALVLNAFVQYMTIAFISFGWRDAYYYAAAAWVAVKALTVLGMELDRLIAALAPSNTAAILSVMGLFVLIAAQVVFTRLLTAPSEVSEVQAARKNGDVITEDDVRKIPLMGVMAIAPQSQVPLPSTIPNVHVAQSVMQMGETFGLSGREIEVCTLYALGHTQQHISEELHLSTNTVHTHVKRIYNKTDLHSRQEILDYINEYGV